MRNRERAALISACAVLAGYAPNALSCPCHGDQADPKKWAAFKKNYKVIKKARHPSAETIPALLPFAGGKGNLSAWGGSAEGQRWRPEAILANAASAALNAAWRLPDVKDVSVAVPTHFTDSGFHPYGDGQSNSGIDFNSSWKQSRPQIIASLVQFESTPPKVLFRIDRTIQRAAGAPTPAQLEILYSKSGAPTRLKIPLTTDASGDFVGEWTNLPAELHWNDPFHNIAVLVRPQPAYGDWFPIFFRLPVRTADALIAAAPPFKARFTGNMSSLSLVDSNGKYQDPLGVAALTSGLNSHSPFQALMTLKFPAGYNQLPYTPANIHGELGAGGPVTGVGKGWTWVAEDKQARPFKIMYTCFQRRQPQAEAQAPNNGVASGGGWHSINNKTPNVDPDVPVSGAAEIIVNSLERESLVVAGGYVDVASRSDLAAVSRGEKISYGLTDLAVVRWLRPGEGFITSAGSPQPNHHWYFFAQDREVCTEEWVGQCGTDFACQ